MLKHINILIAYFIIAVALSFKMGFTAPVLLFVAQPAILIAAYWRKLPKLKAKGLYKLILTFFICLYGFRLFEYAYDIVVHNEATFKPSMLHDMVFAVIFAVSFEPVNYPEGDQVES
jgi:hypothetical protein